MRESECLHTDVRLAIMANSTLGAPILTQNAVVVRPQPAQPHTVTENQAGQRLDNFLLSHFKGVPRSHIYRLLRSGQVRVNSSRVRPMYKLRCGDVLRLPPVRVSQTPQVRVPDAFVDEIEAAVLHEDARLLVLNKPAGCAVHAGSGVLYGVVEALRQSRSDLPDLGLAHRLDKDTSGVLVLAKERNTLNAVQVAFRQRKVTKLYRALVDGDWPAQVTQHNAALRKDQAVAGERRVVVDAAGQAARSHFTVLQRFGGQASLLEVRIDTGRTHQIRVHAADVGHPVAGDYKYGRQRSNQQFRRLGLKRMFLHAASLQLQLAGQPYHFAAPLPPELQGFLKQYAHVR